MKEGPQIVQVAALIADHARSSVLTALMSDRALTATELADMAGVSRSTMSEHLAKLIDGGLICMEKQGRHRYFRLANSEVASMLESLMHVAFGAGAVPLRSSPREPAMRRARVCYDHLAGELGVTLYDGLKQSGALVMTPAGLVASERGHNLFEDFGIKVKELAHSRRPVCRECLDWSERRFHLAGSLGAAILAQILAVGWAKRVPDTRIVKFHAEGERQLLAWACADHGKVGR